MVLLFQCQIALGLEKCRIHSQLAFLYVLSTGLSMWWGEIDIAAVYYYCLFYYYFDLNAAAATAVTHLSASFGPQFQVLYYHPQEAAVHFHPITIVSSILNKCNSFTKTKNSWSKMEQQIIRMGCSPSLPYYPVVDTRTVGCWALLWWYWVFVLKSSAVKKSVVEEREREREGGMEGCGYIHVQSCSLCRTPPTPFGTWLNILAWRPLTSALYQRPARQPSSYHAQSPLSVPVCPPPPLRCMHTNKRYWPSVPKNTPWNRRAGGRASTSTATVTAVVVVTAAGAQ